MRFMIIVKNSGATENVELPPEAYEEMGKYNQSLVDAGILLAGEGLTGSKDGAIVTFRKGGKFEVKDGPFTEAKEIVGGFALLEASSREHAIELTRRFLQVAGEGECEIRQLYEAGDAGGCVEAGELAAHG